MNILSLTIVGWIFGKKIHFSIIYLETLTWLDFFANWGRSTPNGRGQPYKIWGESEGFQFFAKIVKISRNSDFRDQSGPIFSQIGDDRP
jgi:hypothetical protein